MDKKAWMPTDIQYENQDEIVVREYCNMRLSKYGFIFYPKETKYDPDIRVVYEETGELVCEIEVEAKTDCFNEYPEPPSKWPYWSFLDRKISNKIFTNNDIYWLCEKDSLSPNMFAWPFGKIRNFPNLIKDERIPNNRHEIYWRIPIKDICLWTTWDDIAKYLLELL